MQNILPDILIAGGLLLGLILGAKRGFVKTVANVVVLIVALAGSLIIANVFTETVTEALEPRVEERVLEKYQAEASLSNPVTAVDELLAKYHIESAGAKKLAHKLVMKSLEHEENVVTAVVSSMLGTVVHAALLVLGFIALTIILRLVVKALDIVSKLPVIHQANGLLGGLIGLLEAVIVIYVAVWACRRFGWFITEEDIEQSMLLHIFANGNPLELVASLIG